MIDFIACFACYHVTLQKDYFTMFQEGNIGFVKMGNKGSSHILDIGDICVFTNLEVKLTLKNARLIPDLYLNLLSAGKIDEEGYTSCFGEER